MIAAELKGGIELFESEDGRVRVECRLDEGSLWLTQKLIADLFEKDVRTVNEHPQNVFAEGELLRDATIRKFRLVQQCAQTAVTVMAGPRADLDSAMDLR